MKKYPIIQVDSETVKYFLHNKYEQLNTGYYHKYRHACIPLSYWIDLVLLELRGAVSEDRRYKPYFTPIRHENRCNKKSPTLEK